MLWSAIEKARIIIRDSRDIYKNATPRIVAITQHNDESSFGHTAANLVDRLVSDGIILDAVDLNRNTELCAVCQLTGGNSICTEPNEAGLAWSEIDAFLDIKLRNRKNPVHARVSNKVFEQQVSSCEFTNELISCKVSTATRAVYDIVRRPSYSPVASNPRVTRIMSELKSTNAAGIKAFPGRDAIDVWRIGFQIPGDNSENPLIGNNQWWELIVEFPAEYPNAPPDVRFMPPIPYHINVASDGRICLPTLSSRYHSSISIIDIVNEISALLRQPVPENAVSAARLAIWLCDRQLFNENARMARDRQPWIFNAELRYL